MNGGREHLVSSLLWLGREMAGVLATGSSVQSPKLGSETTGELPDLSEAWTKIEDRLAAPEALGEEDPSILQTELVTLVGAGLTAHQERQISDGQLAQVGARGIRFLDEIADRADAGSGVLRRLRRTGSKQSKRLQGGI